MSWLNSLTHPHIKSDKFDIVWLLGLILLGLGLSVVTAYLVVQDNWTIAVGLILALPAALLLNQYPFLGLIIWLLLTPFLVDLSGGGSNIFRKVFWLIHRSLPVVTIGIIVLSSLLGIRRRKLPKLGWAEFGMAGYMLVTILSTLYQSDDIRENLIHCYDRVFIPMCLYLLIRLLQPGKQKLRWMMPVLIFIVISQSIIGILSWSAPQVLPEAWLDRAGSRTYGSLQSYSVFSSTLMFCGLFILYFALNQSSKVKRFWYVVLFSLTLFMVFFTFSRGSWLAGIFVLVGLAFIYPKFITRYLFVAIPIIALVVSGGLLTSQLDWASERYSSEDSTESAMSRMPIMYASLKMWEAKPLFGWGWGNFDRYDREFQARVMDFNAVKDHASHNVYLTLLAEQGAIGFSLFTLPMFFWLLQTIKVWSRLPTGGFMNRSLLAMFWLVILFHIVVNNFSNMRVVFGLGMWWMTLGLIANLIFSHLERKSSLRSNFWMR